MNPKIYLNCQGFPVSTPVLKVAMHVRQNNGRLFVFDGYQSLFVDDPETVRYRLNLKADAAVEFDGMDNNPRRLALEEADGRFRYFTDKFEPTEEFYTPA